MFSRKSCILDLLESFKMLSSRSRSACRHATLTWCCTHCEKGSAICETATRYCVHRSVLKRWVLFLPSFLLTQNPLFSV
jgi:hypothetical protein